MFVGFQECTKHLPSINTRLVLQPISDVEQLWESKRDDLVKIASTLCSLEPVYATYCQQTLNASKDYKLRPFVGEVVGEDFLNGREELSTNNGRGDGEKGNYSLSASGFFLLRNRSRKGMVIGWRPAFGNAVFQIDDSCRTKWLAIERYVDVLSLLESRMP